jgi:hypothetical protein
MSNRDRPQALTPLARGRVRGLLFVEVQNLNVEGQRLKLRAENLELFERDTQRGEGNLRLGLGERELDHLD